MSVRSILLFLVIFISFSGEILPQSEQILGNHKVRGTVKTSESEIIAGLTLIVSKNGQDHTFVSDTNGEFELSLSPGDYVLTLNKCVSADFRAFIKIQDVGLNPNDLEFVLDSSDSSCNRAHGANYPNPTSLPRPAYPPAARAVHAEGEVTVEITVDKNGKVKSVKAVDGHPLLRLASESAARGSHFEASELAEDRKATLTYVFLVNDSSKPERKRYKNIYRIEVFVPSPVF